MGMGNYAQYADTIPDKFVRETCPEEIDILQEYLDKHDCDWGQLGDAGNFGNEDIEGELALTIGDEGAAEICNAYYALCQKFKEKTGLELDARYHNKEDRGDEVDGFFWSVDGVYVLSESGEKYKDKIQRLFFTVFG